MRRRDLVALAVIGVGVIAAAAGGSLAAIDASDQYAELEQPSWAPPSWLFGPVWTVLYITIAIAGFMVWRSGGWSMDMKLWTAQLVVNGAWTPLFFALEWRFVALAWIVLLDALVAWLIVRQWPKWPARLMVPYLGWIVFATGLNAAVWWLNR